MEIPDSIETAHLFAPLHGQLIRLLEGLSPDDWSKPTVCRGWAVRDIAAHLLDVDIRRISFSADKLEMPPPDPPITGYSGLVDYLNRLNAEWVTAARRISPRLLVEFLRFTGPQVARVVGALDMAAPSRHPVAWAGEELSLNWFDVARDYTERWHHQEQIRDAVGAVPLTGAAWLSPVLATFLKVLPHSYRNTLAEERTAILFHIEGEAGGLWTLWREPDRWELRRGSPNRADAVITFDQDTAWRLFTKGIPVAQARERVRIEGQTRLGEPLLRSIAVIALPEE